MERTKQSSSWLIQLGVVLMAFGIGGFLGYLAGRIPSVRQPAPAPAASDRATLDRAERHANSADYVSRRLVIGTSKLERRHP